MDFIETLPTSSGCDSILVIVDLLSKQGIFIPTTIHCTSKDLAGLFAMHVFSKHGVPEHVTSDRGPEFVSRFFRFLGKALDMKLHFTSRYHLEGDGQTERTNQTLEQYLWIFNKITGTPYFHLRNLHTTILQVLLRESLRSSLIRDTIRTSPSIPNATSCPPVLKTL